ncbi:hypothetical protein LIER_22921 [Lithospermum erythrorhizon]|uniref:Uncharacterized protein n=1 Tax=Lithospermum erythrorhizon TaxID=34254 RepID=A0AAV3QZT4_LITER
MLNMRDKVKPYVKMQLFHIESTQFVAEVGDMIRWPEGMANTSNVQIFKSGFPMHFDDDDDQLKWFGSDSCKTVNVWNELRIILAHVWW